METRKTKNGIKYNVQLNDQRYLYIIPSRVQRGAYHGVKSVRVLSDTEIEAYVIMEFSSWGAYEYKAIFVHGNGHSSEWPFLTREDTMNLSLYGVPWTDTEIMHVAHNELGENDAEVRSYWQRITKKQNEWVASHPFYKNLKEKFEKSNSVPIASEDYYGPGSDL